MKIQKGVLAETERVEPAKPAPHPSPSPRLEVEKNRLFETLEKEKSGNRSYIKLLLVAIVVVLIGGGLVFYLTLPRVGEVVRAPKGAEDAVRGHLQDKQKREADDITFYYCGERSYWARADVKTRTDMPNPVFKIGKYAVTVKGEDPAWDISSKPIASSDDDKPCS